MPDTTRGAVAAFHLQLIALLEAAGVTDDHDINDLTVNVNYRAHRIDIATLSDDGQHVEQWLCGFAIDPRNLPAFGTPVSLPGGTRTTH
jgi:hypothetical protein